MFYTVYHHPLPLFTVLVRYSSHFLYFLLIHLHPILPSLPPHYLLSSLPLVQTSSTYLPSSYFNPSIHRSVTSLFLPLPTQFFIFVYLHVPVFFIVKLSFCFSSSLTSFFVSFYFLLLLIHLISSFPSLYNVIFFFLSRVILISYHVFYSPRFHILTVILHLVFLSPLPPLYLHFTLSFFSPFFIPPFLMSFLLAVHTRLP